MNRVLSFFFVLCLMLGFGVASAQTTYTKVTSASQLVDGGKYLIVYEDGNVAFDGSLTSLDAVSNTKAVTITDGAISVSDNDFYFTLGVIEGGFSVKSASEYYIGNTSDANTIKTSQTEAYVNTIEVTASSTEIISAGTHLRFNSASNQNRFRYFKSTSYTNQKAISLFVDASSLSDDPMISITTPSNGSTIYTSSVTATVQVLNFTAGTDGNISFAIDSEDAIVGTETSHTFNDLTDGQHTITASLVATDETVVATATTTFTVDLDGPTTTPIHDIQYTEAEDGASPYNGQTVTVSGTVTALNSDKFYIQDAEAAWSGLYIYNTNSGRTPSRNDNVTVTGTITEYNGLTEMSPVTEVVNNGAVTPVNGLSLASISEIAEPYESVLVTVTGTCTNIGGAKKWTISDGTSIVVFGLTYTPTVGTSYTVTGIVDWFGQDGIWELKPRSEADIVAGAGVPSISITSPVNGSTVYSSTVNATVEVLNFTAGTDGNISFAIDSEDAIVGTETSHTFEGLTDGEHTITASLVATDETVVSTATTTFTVDLDGPTTTPIHDIQYTEAEDGASPYNGQTVTVSGTVTALNSDKFYIQDAEAAWSGLYIYNTNSGRTPSRNDNVTVTGTITEYNGLTEMSPVTEVVNNGAVTPVNGLSLASISEIGEPYESVLVTVTGTCTEIGGTKKWTISDGTSIVVFGLTYTPTVGTSYTVTGIVDWYGQDNIWELKPRSEADIVAGASVPSISITSPVNGSTVYSSTVNATVEVLNFTAGTDGNISFAIDSEDAIVGTETSHTFEGLTDGEHTITASLVATDETVVSTATTTFTVDLDGPTTTPIHDIQYTEAEDGASPYNGQTVTVSGTVTALNSDKFYIQDAEAAWSGLYIYNTNSGRTPSRNDNVTVTGTITEYNGLTEMSPVTEVVNNGAVTPVNGLSLASISEIGEPYESVLVTVTGTCTEIGGTKKWTISDGTSIVVFGLTYTPTVGTSYTVTGIVDWYGQDNIWELKPRDENDIVVGAAAPTISITSPANGSTVYSSSVNATVEVVNFEIGTDGNISFSIDNEAAISGTATSHTYTDLNDGEHTIIANLVGTNQSVIATATTTFTVDLDGPTTTPIHDIQYTEAEDGASPYNGQTVTVSGTVTALNSDKFYIQDAEAAWSGLYIYNTNSGRTPSRNDNVTVTGTITEYNGLTEMSPVTEVVNNGAVTPVNGLSLASISEIGEPYESVLVTVTGTCTEIGGTKKWTISDGTSIVVFGLTYTPTVGTSYTVTGIVDWYGQDNIWELKPRDENDIVAGAAVPAISITNPANGSTVYSSTVNATVEVLNFTVGTDGNISFSIDNGTAVTGTSTLHTFEGLTDGQHTITASLVGTNQSVIATATTTFTVDLDGPTTTPIHDIQYTEAEDGASPYNGQTVTVSGTVTALNSDKFYIQDAEAAWSGLYIYNTNSGRTPSRNDNVTVTGTITEYNGLTEMSPVTEVVNNGAVTPVNGLSLASISEIGEPYESVLVTVTGTCTEIGGTKKWTISDGTSIVVFGLTYTPTVGTSYTVTGIVDWYGQDNIWELKPRDENDIVVGAAAPTISITSPANGSTVYSSSVNATVEVVNFEIGTDGNISFSIDNEDAVTGTATSHTFTDLTDGEHTITASLVGTNQSIIATTTTTFTVDLDGPTLTPIHDIQYTEAEDGASPYNGQTVIVSGIVTALNSDKFYIQDAEAAWSGLYIYNTNSGRTPSRNDNVTVTGTITEYNGLTEMSPVTEVVNNGAVTPVNGLSLASISEIAEPYESVLVTVTGTCTNIGGAKKWTISDGTSIVVFGLTYTPTVGTSYTVTGIVDWFGQDGIWELKPRSEADIVVGATVPTITITNPANGSTIYEAAVNATVEVFNYTVVAGDKFSFSIDDEDATIGTDASHVFTGLTAGQHTIHASLVANNNSVIATATSTFTVDFTERIYTAIRDIQYTEDANGDSPLNNQTVWVKGVVTSNFINTPYFPVKGYSIQDANEAWSGIWVFDSNNNPNIGDSVRFQALVTEYYGLTELKNVSNFEIYDMGIVSPIDVTAYEVNNEAYEGCYVRVECVRSVGSTMPYGNWSCVNETGDTVTFSHNFENGTYNITKDSYYGVSGVVEYNRGYYYVNYPSLNDIVADCNLDVDEILENSIEVYPNPTNGQINITNAEGQNIVVINTLGQVVATVENASENQIIDMSGLCDGTYFVKVGASVVKINVIR